MGNIINLKKTWEKLLLAARAIAAVENPQDVYVVASRPYAQRAVLKFARYVGCSSIAGRFTPDLFFYRDPEEAEKEERERAEAAAESQLVGKGDFAVPAAAIAAPAAGAAFQVTEDWAAQTEASDWAAQSAPEGVPGANTWGGSSQW